MFVNYGDYNFFEYGMLVDSGHFDTTFSILYCRPYDDEEDVYQFAECVVDITDSWIDKQAVLSFIGQPNVEDDPIQYAIGCLEYYGAENFGAGSGLPTHDWRQMSKADICEILKHRQISDYHLDICW